MINSNLKYMKSKESQPYDFYFINELLFHNLLDQLLLEKSERKISTIGILKDYNYITNECTLILDNSNIMLNFSRIENSFKLTNDDSYYMVYGVLKVIVNLLV